MTVMSDDGLHKDDFVEDVGGELHLRKLYSSRVGLIESKPDEEASGCQKIGAGRSFVKFCDLRAGQKVEWKFQLVIGTGDYLKAKIFGASDIEFKATYFKLPDKTSSETAASEES